MGLVREFPMMESSQPRMWTTGDYDLSGITLQEFNYTINLHRDSLPWTWTQWCRENCHSQWAWWFDNNNCYVGFTDQEEAFLFMLTYVGTET